MSFFKKAISPAALGAVIYDSVYNTFLDGPMSYDNFAARLVEDPADLPDGYENEVLMALLYSAIVAVNGVYEDSIAGPILESIENVYVSHSVERGLIRNQVEQVREQFHQRVRQYASSSQNTTGIGPSWHLGKAFFWNVVGEERKSAVGVTFATQYFFASVDEVKGVLKNFKCKN